MLTKINVKYLAVLYMVREM